MIKRFRFVLILVLATVVGGCVTTGPRMALPDPWLDSAELTALFKDHTVESVNAKSGRVSRTYYAPDGRVVQWRDGTWRYGKWRVRNGRICLRMENKKEKCRAVIRDNGVYKKYIIKRDGNHRLVVTYRWFEPGNRLGRN